MKSSEYIKLDAIRIILVETSHPGNIGSTSRAMKTMGLQELYLVNPKKYPHKQAIEMAAGADDILENARVVPCMADALKGCQLVFATSARPREIDLPGLNPREQAEIIHQASAGTKVAIVFGREHAGLTNDELLLCQYHTCIPSNPAYSSLNLAQSVQVVAYELRMICLTEKPVLTTHEGELATSEDIERFYEHLQAILVDIAFLKPSNPRRLMQKLRRLFNRVRLEDTEVNILRGILTQIDKKLSSRKEL